MSDEKMNQEVDEVEIDVEETSTSDNDTGSDRPDSNQDRLVKTNVSDDSGDDGDELESYSKNVQKRIKKLTEKYRQEERDREEAVRLAQQLHEENQTLKTQMQSSQQGYLNEYGSRLENQLNLAKQAYRDAHDRGDVDKMFDAQQVLSKIAIEQERYRLAKAQQEKLAVQRAPEQQTQQTQQAPQQRAAPPKPDPKAEAWASKHEWFGQDDVMTYAAFGIHRRLVEEEGFDPNSDEYYNEIDRRMVSEFPHKFAGQKNGRSSQVASADTSASRKKTTGRRTVKLSPSQVAMARKLNVPLEEYAKYVKD
jgi:hypothetical protein